MLYCLKIEDNVLIMYAFGNKMPSIIVSIISLSGPLLVENDLFASMPL